MSALATLTKNTDREGNDFFDVNIEYVFEDNMQYMAEVSYKTKEEIVKELESVFINLEVEEF